MNESDVPSFVMTFTTPDAKSSHGRAPRVTDDYYFETHPGDGYAPSNSIFFKGATGAASLRTYLETLGYTKEKRRLGDKEIWSKPDQVKGDIFYLYFNAATGEVELTKVMSD